MVENTSNESSSDITKQSKEPEIPDGGYGWVITFASFMCHFVADGIAFTFGVIYTELIVEFQGSKSATSWIGSLFAGMPLICAPIAGLMVNRYGCRLTTIIGGLITSVGLLISSFARSVEVMAISYGVIAGFGLSFVYVPASVIPSFWFEKKRSFVTGIAKSGTGIGTFAMAPLMEYLIYEFSWRGALLILSGITLNLVFFGALFRPLPYEEDEDSNDEEENEDKLEAVIELRSLKSKTDLPELAVLSASSISIPAKLSKSHEFLSTAVEFEPLGTPTIEDTEPLHISNSDPLCTSNKDIHSTEESPQVIIHVPSTHHMRRHRHRLRHHHQKGVPLNQLKRSTKSLLPRSKWDITSIIALAERKKFTTSAPELSVPFMDDATESSKPFKAWSVLKRALLIGHEICDVRLFKLPVYLLFFLSNFILSYAYNFPYVYLPDYAAEQGVTNESFLISIIGIVNMVGQILYGFLGDNKRINTLTLYGLSTVACGILVSLMPVMKTYAVLGSACGLFGLLISANFALETVVLVQILSLDELTKAYSLLMFGQGVATLVGPPIGGQLNIITITIMF